MLKQFQNNKRGFFIVELTIVLIIVGLLVGGVSVGVSLIDKAKMVTAVKSLEAFKTAASTFRLNYGVAPGRLENPEEHFVSSMVSQDGKSFICEKDNSGKAYVAGSGIVSGVLAKVKDKSGTDLTVGTFAGGPLLSTIAMCQIYVSGSANMKRAVPSVDVIKPDENAPAFSPSFGASMFYIEDPKDPNYYYIAIANASKTGFDGTITSLNNQSDIEPRLMKKLDMKLDNGKQGTGKFMVLDEYKAADPGNAAPEYKGTKCQYSSSDKSCFALWLIDPNSEI